MSSERKQDEKVDPVPVVLRRRLSAPETIMRKHTLAQQYSDSSETDTSQLSSSSARQGKSYWNRNSTAGSESNLSKRHCKYDSNQMRKSTLMRRLWSREFGGSAPKLQQDSPKSSAFRQPEAEKTSNQEDQNGNVESSSISVKSEKRESLHSRTYSETISRVSSTSGSNKSVFYTSSTDIRTSTSPKMASEEIYSTSSVVISTTNDNNNDSAYTNTYLTDRSATSSSSNNNQIKTHIEQTPQRRPDTQTERKESKPEETSFYLIKRTDDPISADHKRIIKYMISNVGTGSSYAKPTELPQLVVPRYSAIPRTTSMEVNTSSNESAADSDTGSLVDSLDDPNSPRQSAKGDKKSNSLLLLPDNSTARTKSRKYHKGDAFYIPIENSTTQNDQVKTVAERMPDRVRERLTKRLQKMEQKKLMKNSVAGNQTVTHTPDSHRDTSISTDNHSSGATKKRSKKEKRMNKLAEPRRRKIYVDTSRSSPESVPKRIYRKTEVSNPSKRIEILEIMECIDTSKASNQLRFRSKIPVLMNNNKPIHLPIVPYTYPPLDDDPKVDQLIANLLIDALNKTDMQIAFKAKSPTSMSGKYQQRFDMIPEEKFAAIEDASCVRSSKVEAETQVDQTELVPTIPNKTTDAAIQTDFDHRYDGRDKPAIAMMREEDFSTIPKGWITFYMLRKNQSSPDSSNDEGSVKLPNQKGSSTARVNSEAAEDEENNNDNNDKLAEVDGTFNDSFTVSKNEHFTSSSESFHNRFANGDHENDQRSLCPIMPIPCLTTRHRRQSHKRTRFKGSTQNPTSAAQSQLLGGWSVTVSGTNANGQSAPDLEMRLKFPTQQANSQSDSGLGEEHPQKPKNEYSNDSFHLPPTTKPVQIKKYTVLNKKQKDVGSDFQHLPDLMKSKNNKVTKRRESGVPVRVQPASAIPQMPPLKQRGGTTTGPRQTLTSYRRFSLHHSTHLPPHLRTMFPSMSGINTSDMMELPECFPGILAVMGSAIAPEKKPNILTITNRLSNANSLSIGNHH